MHDRETLIDVVMIDGVPKKKVQRPDGSIIYEDLEEEKIPSITQRFKDTATVPNDWQPETTTPLIAKEGLTKAQHVNRSCRIEAVLVKAFSPRMKRGEVTETIDTNGNTALKELLIDLCKAMGGEYEQYIKHIK